MANSTSSSNLQKVLEEKCRLLENQYKTLKDVSTIRKDLLDLREHESKNFISKLENFETICAFEKESRMKLSEKLKETEKDYKELNIKFDENLKLLIDTDDQYKADVLELKSELNEAKTLIQSKESEIVELKEQLNQANEKCKQLEEQNQTRDAEIHDYKLKITELEIQAAKSQEEINSIISENEELKKQLSLPTITQEPEELPNNEVVIKNLQEELEEIKTKNKSLLYQMSLLNSLFNETEGTPIDFDKIREIGNIMKEESQNNSPETEEENQVALEGIHNRMEVLLQEKALSDVHGIIDQLDSQNHKIPGEESCYKSTDTSGGPKLVLSVSRTFLKLKDLILEKKSLQKQIDGLKDLNGKLETKVDKQQRRLYFVALELNKTWSLVSKLKAQHSQLHNTRSSQRYDLQEKRKLLERLKRDLHLSREKWIKVRQKNSESQKEWDIIHDEFEQRKIEREKKNSGSGGLQYSDSRESAFSDDFSSTTTTTTGEAEEAGPSSIGSGTSSPNMQMIRKLSKPKDDDSLDGFVSDIANEMNTIEAAVNENVRSDDDNDDAEIVPEVDGSTSSWTELANKRAQRLSLLEEQCRLLYTKLKASTVRNTELASKLADLHNHYGSSSSDAENVDEEYSEYDEVLLPVEDENPNSTNLAVSLPNEGSSTGEQDEEQQQQNAYDSESGPVQSSSGIFSLDSISISPGLENEEEMNNNSPDFAETEQELLAELRRTIEAVVDDSPSSSSANENAMTLTTKVVHHTESSEHDGVVIDMVEELNDNDNNNPTEPTPTESFLNINRTILLDDDSCNSTTRSSPDLNVLSRLIIQQFPKRLDVLKNENRSLRAELRETEAENSAQASLIMELRNELELKQKLIEELTSKIQVATESYETINREHGRMAEYFRIKMQEREVQQQRKIAKARNAKDCKNCSKKFNIFKRKFHCINCGHAYCNDCLTTSTQANAQHQCPEVGSSTSRSNGSSSGSGSCTTSDDDVTGKNYKKSQKKQRLCKSCIERKQRLDTAIALAVKSTSSSSSSSTSTFK